MDPSGVAMLVAAGVLVSLVGALGFLWERRRPGPVVLLDPERHRRAITSHRYYRDVHDSTTGGGG